MAHDHQMICTRVPVSVALSRIRISAAALAALEPGDTIEVEPEIGADIMARLMVNGTTVAIASVAEENGRLIATIARLAPDQERRIDRWQFRKKETISD